MLATDIETIIGNLENKIYIGYMPDGTDILSNICVITPSGGYSPDRCLDGSKSIEQPTVQVMIRDESYNSGDIRIRAIMDKLDTFSGVINGVKYLHMIKMQSEPISLGNDEKGRNLFAINFHVSWEKTKV